MAIRIDIQGQVRLEQVFDGINKALNQTEILDEGSALLLSRLRRRFLQQKDPEGKDWIPSKAALKRKAKGRGGGTLFDTGRLFHSIQLARSTESERFIGSDVFYGVYHNEGRPQHGLPRREFMGFGENDVDTMRRLIINRLRENLSGLGI